MSEYRPWAPTRVDENPEQIDAETEASVDSAPPYSPWAGQAPGQEQQTANAPVAPPNEKRFEAPPGLGEAPSKKRTATGETAAAMLLWTGGFLLVTAILSMAFMTLIIDIERMDMRYDGSGDPDVVREMEKVRGYMAWGMPASLLFLVPGVGLLYHQPWARPLGFAASGLALLLVPPFGTTLGIIALVSLSRMEGP